MCTRATNCWVSSMSPASISCRLLCQDLLPHRIFRSHLSSPRISRAWGIAGGCGLRGLQACGRLGFINQPMRKYMDGGVIPSAKLPCQVDWKKPQTARVQTTWSFGDETSGRVVVRRFSRRSVAVERRCASPRGLPGPLP